MGPKKYPQERVLTVIGAIGAVMIPFGSAWNFGGKSIVLPLLGIGVPSSVVLIGGSLLMVGAIVADNHLSQRRTREQIIRDRSGLKKKTGDKYFSLISALCTIHTASRTWFEEGGALSLETSTPV